jgi:hypothetical protein
MSRTNTSVPVHDSLTVLDSADIYHTLNWWKAAVRYRFDDADEYDEVAVYLWHREDDGWKRKNKYVIKSAEAWRTDRSVIESLLDEESSSQTGQSEQEFPVSDYYTVGSGKTIFKSDGWWKAILRITQKGTYETSEVMVYLWQLRDDDWVRRQKYAIKDEESWRDEKAAIESVLGQSVETSPPDDVAETDDEERGSSVTTEIESLGAELEAHLSREFQ